MDNRRNLAILKKCVNSTSSLQNFVEELEKNVSKDCSNIKDQQKNYAVGEIINISEIETITFGPAILESEYDPGVETTFDITTNNEISDEVIPELEGHIVEVEVGEEDLGAEMIENALERMPDVECGEESVEQDILAQIVAESGVGSNLDSNTSEMLEVVEDEEEVHENLLTRKRGRKPKTWTRTIAKTNRNLGEAYTNLKTGKSFPARSVQPACEDHCSFKCKTYFNSDERGSILKEYWGLGDVNKQREFINNITLQIKPQYRYTRDGSSRKNNLSYHFLKEEVLIRVCKKFFCNTLNISAKAIETAKSKFMGNVIQPDLRGTHKMHLSISAELQQGIKDHINSFERIESHYLREQTKREYIDGSLNVSLMYRMYKEQCTRDGIQFAKQHVYEQIFNCRFNIGFFKPKKDQCVQCFQFENSTELLKTSLQEEHSKHISEKELSRLEKEADKQKCESNNNIKVVCMDLQAVIPVPCGDVSSFYYKRRLLCFNFTIFELFSNEGFCFLWHEGIAHRGSDEIAACLKIYIDEKCSDVDHLIIWSDNCSGQISNIKSISQKFLIVGHTQNEGDNMHSLIEKNKARCLKSGPIFTCDQLVPIIQLAKKTKPLYKVHQLQTNEVYDLKDLCAKTGKNFTKNVDGEKVVWADIKEFKVEKKNLNRVQYRTSFTDTNFKSFKVSNENKCIDLKLAYLNGSPTIPTLKKKDLMDLCQQNSITASHHQFFKNLRTEEPEVHFPINVKRRRAGA